jgi:hypothetical protein
MKFYVPTPDVSLKVSNYGWIVVPYVFRHCPLSEAYSAPTTFWGLDLLPQTSCILNSRQTVENIQRNKGVIETYLPTAIQQAYKTPAA